jgi:hypothetical protein
MLEKTLRYQKADHLPVTNVDCPPGSPMLQVRVSAELKQLCDEIAWDQEIPVVVSGLPQEKASSGESDLIQAVSVNTLEKETDQSLVKW